MCGLFGKVTLAESSEGSVGHQSIRLNQRDCCKRSWEDALGDVLYISPRLSLLGNVTKLSLQAHHSVLCDSEVKTMQRMAVLS